MPYPVWRGAKNETIKIQSLGNEEERKMGGNGDTTRSRQTDRQEGIINSKTGDLHVDHKRVIYLGQDILLVADVHHLL